MRRKFFFPRGAFAAVYLIEAGLDPLKLPRDCADRGLTAKKQPCASL